MDAEHLDNTFNKAPHGDAKSISSGKYEHYDPVDSDDGYTIIKDTELGNGLYPQKANPGPTLPPPRQGSHSHNVEVNNAEHSLGQVPTPPLVVPEGLTESQSSNIATPQLKLIEYEPPLPPLPPLRPRSVSDVSSSTCTVETDSEKESLYEYPSKTDDNCLKMELQIGHTSSNGYDIVVLEGNQGPYIDMPATSEDGSAGSLSSSGFYQRSPYALKLPLLLPVDIDEPIDESSSCSPTSDVPHAYLLGTSPPDGNTPNNADYDPVFVSDMNTDSEPFYKAGTPPPLILHHNQINEDRCLHSTSHSRSYYPQCEDCHNVLNQNDTWDGVTHNIDSTINDTVHTEWSPSLKQHHILPKGSINQNHIPSKKNGIINDMGEGKCNMPDVVPR